MKPASSQQQPLRMRPFFIMMIFFVFATVLISEFKVSVEFRQPLGLSSSQEQAAFTDILQNEHKQQRQMKLQMANANALLSDAVTTTTTTTTVATTSSSSNGINDDILSSPVRIVPQQPKPFTIVCELGGEMGNQ